MSGEGDRKHEVTHTGRKARSILNVLFVAMTTKGDMT